MDTSGSNLNLRPPGPSTNIGTESYNQDGNDYNDLGFQCTPVDLDSETFVDAALLEIPDRLASGSDPTNKHCQKEYLSENWMIRGLFSVPTICPKLAGFSTSMNAGLLNTGWFQMLKKSLVKRRS
jgi:hypothetical protein